MLALLLERLPTSFFLISTLTRPTTSSVHISSSLSFSHPVLFSFLSRSYFLSSQVFGVGIYSVEKPQNPGESCSAGWKQATEPMNRFFQRRPEGQPSFSSTRIAEKKHVEPGIPAKSLNRCFYRFSFWKKGITAPALRCAGFAARLRFYRSNFLLHRAL